MVGGCGKQPTHFPLFLLFFKYKLKTLKIDIKTHLKATHILQFLVGDPSLLGSWTGNIELELRSSLDWRSQPFFKCQMTSIIQTSFHN